MELYTTSPICIMYVMSRLIEQARGYSYRTKDGLVTIDPSKIRVKATGCRQMVGDGNGKVELSCPMYYAFEHKPARRRGKVAKPSEAILTAGCRLKGALSGSLSTIHPHADLGDLAASHVKYRYNVTSGGGFTPEDCIFNFTNSQRTTQT